MKPSDPHQLLVALVKILDRLKIPYMVTGGIAVLMWGRIRLTADIDVVIKLKQNKIAVLRKALLFLGKHIYLDADAMQEALKSYGEFNLIHADSGLKVDFWILNDRDPFDASRFKRRIYKSKSGLRLAFIAPEDLILSKLKWYRESGSIRQLEDVESILQISGKDLNIAYLKKWAQKIGVSKFLNRLL